LAHADLGGHPLCSVLALCPGNLNTSAASPCTRAALSQPAAGADRRVALTPDTVAMMLQLIVITYPSIINYLQSSDRVGAAHARPTRALRTPS
jgi:hypothetical protein